MTLNKEAFKMKTFKKIMAGAMAIATLATGMVGFSASASLTNDPYTASLQYGNGIPGSASWVGNMELYSGNQGYTFYCDTLSIATGTNATLTLTSSNHTITSPTLGGRTFTQGNKSTDVYITPSNANVYFHATLSTTSYPAGIYSTGKTIRK
jgi:hypothetical protein